MQGSKWRSAGPGFELGGKRLRVRIALGACLVASAPGIAGGARGMALSVAVLLSALFAHELGHALSALAFGSRATVVLHALGGYTEIEPRLPRRQDVITSLMGPLVSLALGSLLYFAHKLLPSHSWLPAAMRVNLAWGAMHLLPVLPFDGGKILLSTVGVARHGRAIWASGAIALVIATEALFIAHSALFFFVFGVAAVSSLGTWVKLRRAQLEARFELPERLARARVLLQQGKADGALELAGSVTELARSNTTSNEAWHLIAWAELELGQPQRARSALERVVPSHTVDCYCVAATEAALGFTRRAVSILEQARAESALGVGATKLLIDSYARLGLLARACAVAKEALALLDPGDTRCVIRAAFEPAASSPRSAIAAATELALALFQRTGSSEDTALYTHGLLRLRERTLGPEDTTGLRDSVV